MSPKEISKKISLSRRDALKVGAAFLGALLAACETPWLFNLTPTSPAAPKPTTIPTPTQPEASPTFKPTPDVLLGPTLPSDYIDFFFGQEMNRPGVVSVGAIKGPSFEANNPGYLIPVFNGVHESRLNSLFRKGNITKVPDAFLIENDYLKQVFHAEEEKGGGLTGRLPDGTGVKFENGLWQAVIDGKLMFFNPLIAGQKGKPFGYPVFADDNKGNFFLGQCFDENGVLVEGTKMEPAFKTAGQIAATAGFAGDTTAIGGVGLNTWGNIIVYDQLDLEASILPYLNKNASPDSFQLNLPEWKKALDSQKAPYRIVDKKIQIDCYDNSNLKNIVIINTDEATRITQTTDVLYPNILTASDVDGKQYAFNPDLGWFRIPDVPLGYDETVYGQLEKYTPVTVDYFTDGRFALVSALKYAENPTISKDAPVATFWVESSIAPNPSYYGYSDFAFISMYPNVDLGQAMLLWPELMHYYTAENKPFAWAGAYKTSLNDGSDYFYSIAMTVKTGLNQTQSLAYSYNKESWENGRSSIVNSLQRKSKGGQYLGFILAPPDDSNFSWNPDLAKYGAAPNPVVGRLQKRGELISLFSPEDRETILKVIRQDPITYDNGFKTTFTTAPVYKLPPELSKYILMPTAGSN